jgi:hypothetical protein
VICSDVNLVVDEGERWVGPYRLGGIIHESAQIA